MSASQDVVREIDTLIVQAVSTSATPEQRAASALAACQRIVAHDVKLIRTFDWIELRRWADARRAERSGKQTRRRA